MATSGNKGASVLQSWVTPAFAREVRELADEQGRSVSNLIKFALRTQLSETPPTDSGESTAPGGLNEEPYAGQVSTRRGADPKERSDRGIPGSKGNANRG